MKVYEALAKAFADEGTSAVFGMMGDTNQHWINAITKLGISMYEVRHEGPGLAMAESWASVNGAPGVCTTTSGPGVTQLATTMVVASRNRMPLIAFIGDSRWGNEQDDHRFDHARFAAAIECGFVRVASPDAAYESVQKAFYLARLESRPIMLSAPLDVQLASFDDTEEYAPSTALISNKAICPNPDVIKEAADIVARSERPVIIVGRGAMRSEAGDAVLKLADRTGALIATSLMAINWLRDADEYQVGVSGLYATRTAMELFQEADCVIAVGASLNRYTTADGFLYPNARFVHFDTQLQVVMGDGRSADCYVQSDARLGLEVLDELLEERQMHQVGFRTPEVKGRLGNALYDPTVYEIEPGTLDPRDACRVLDEVIPKDFGLVLSGSNAMHMAIMLCRTQRPYTIVNRNFGCMSKGIAGVIGAAIATGKPTALIEGDVGFMMHLGEFDTAVRYNLPVFVVILNDQAMGAELHKANSSPDELDPALTLIPTPDLGLIGVGLGGRGHLVRTIEQLRGAAAEFVAEPGPMLVDVRISQSVESIQTRRHHGHEDV